MENKILENTEDSLALIRNKVKEGSVKSDFRKKLIGGISEADVEDYINTVRLQSEYRENKLSEKIEELISFNDKLKIEYNTYRRSAEDEKKKLQKELEEKYNVELERLNVELNMITVERDSLKNQINDIYKEIENSKADASNVDNERRKYENQIDELKNELYGIRRKFDEQSSMFRDLEIQLKNEQISKAKIINENIELNQRSMGSSKELNDLYSELANVKEQVKMNYELQRQLEQERTKTERVEKEMTDFFKRIIDIKGINE